MIINSPSVQSPKAYDLLNLTGAQLGVRLQGAAGATMRGNLRTALQDAAYLFKIHPKETAAGWTDADLTFGFEPGNVLRYGADPTGTSDCTAAFNKATMAAKAYVDPSAGFPVGTPNALFDIYVPPGNYIMAGRVFVRKGQRFRGAVGATYINTQNTGYFQMGWGSNPTGAGPAADGGGQPVGIQDLFILGSGANGAVIFDTVSGGFAYNLFISAPAIGISMSNSGDIQTSNIIIDQGQIGVLFTASSNAQLVNTLFYNLHYDVQFNGESKDILFTNTRSEYNQFSSFLFSAGATVKMRAVDTTWIYNVQYGVVSGAQSPNPTIQNQSTNSDVQFIGFSANNMPGFFYATSTGTGCVSSFANGIIDGNHTLAAYAANQSTTAAAFSIANERVRLSNVLIQNLPWTGGNPIAVAGSATATVFDMRGCEWRGNNASFSLALITASVAGSLFRAVGCVGDKTQTMVNNQAAALLQIRGCVDWFGVIGTSGASHFVLIPFQYSNVYRITLTANINPGGSASYRKSTTIWVEKDNDFSGTAKSFVTVSTAVQGAANLNGLITPVVEFGSVGGTASVASTNAGSLAVSWPNTYGNESVDVDMAA